MYLVPPPTKYTAPLVADDDAPGAVGAANEGSISDGTTRTKSLCIVASIRNLARIESAYGTATALAVRHIVYERAREFYARLRHHDGRLNPSSRQHFSKAASGLPQ
ncbi:hypothetical protein FVF58_46815 [Paraburkholderia panacisoli]|uniref:Uncharacterized protein n=1 Tax=Paraburkholderia panacisoli TaxID=2603818 RepID=A0A5B0G3E8_9BURK|nr:hypothetical protein [Paraburkholderia panacisoli]KAA0997964.1 hypothetical protein FVF58_46815 [Paraburkholderia panacisoli]